MRLMRAIFLVLLVTSQTAFGQCANNVKPSCSVYDSCFAQACECDDSQYEYFISYGKKYCEIFLDLPELSAAGKKWRDSTLRCLQEAIVPNLPPDGQANACNCETMQTLAFDSHVACYTQDVNSICMLPASDWAKILNAIDPVKTLSDAKGRRQMLQVAKICLPVLAGDAAQSAKKIIEMMSN